MLQVTKNIALGAVFGLMMYVPFDYAMSLPDVKMSYSSDACVEVINYPSTFFGTSAYNCEDMPTKFNHVWVK